MNISRPEQRLLHILARGGEIRYERAGGKLVQVTCITREGHVLSAGTLDLVQRLKRRGLIESRGGRPYRISRRGREAVRAQPDNAI